MLYHRSGFPEENEIVLCKVTKLYPNSVFVNLLEYDKPGIVHISEVSPGRIRNLRDFVSIDRQIVCKILKIDQQKGHIDLSLRRVNSTERRDKLDEIKQEMKAEALLKNIAKKLNQPLEKLYVEVSEKILKEYSHLHSCFKEVVSEGIDLKKMGLNKQLADELTSAIIDKFKPKKFIIKGEIKVQTYDSYGLEKIKTLLSGIDKLSPTLGLFYLGAGRYKFNIEDVDHKAAENTLKKIEQLLEKFKDKLSTSVLEREKSD